MSERSYANERAEVDMKRKQVHVLNAGQGDIMYRTGVEAKTKVVQCNEMAKLPVVLVWNQPLLVREGHVDGESRLKKYKEGRFH